MPTEHIPVDYRPKGASRHSVQADVCGTCSDFAAGRLVPVSFCPEAGVKSEELYAYIQGLGARPAWLQDSD